MNNTFEIQLKINIFPELTGYTDDELKHALIFQSFDTGTGLNLFQTTPELAKKATILKYNEVAKMYYKMLQPAMEKFQIPARIVCLLNNTLGSDDVTKLKSENINYAMTFVFIFNDDYSSYKLANIYFGDAVARTGKWANPDQVQLMAKALGVQYYSKGEIDAEQQIDLTRTEK